MKGNPRNLTYAAAGVDEPREQAALARVLHHLQRTYSNRENRLGRPCVQDGGFANVLDLGQGLGLAITTDGVGTKILLANNSEHWRSLAYDCVANNVNDLICLGAEPIALVDYIALDCAEEELLEALILGLRDGADAANISVPGGEIAQVRDMLASSDGRPIFDLVGTAVGLVNLAQGRSDLPFVLDGSRVRIGDVILGLKSSGLHSNGYSLARKAICDIGRRDIDEPLKQLDNMSLRMVLLRPTRIYVPCTLPLLREDDLVHGIVNISGGGLLCLSRFTKKYSIEVEYLPETPRVFEEIRISANLPDVEMYAAFNMGVGLAIAVHRDNVQKARSLLKINGEEAFVLGRIVDDYEPGCVHLQQARLLGRNDVFETD